MRSSRSGVVLVAGLVALAIPASARGAVTIGEDTSAPPGIVSIICTTTPGELCTTAQSVNPTHSFASPIDGVIVRWRIRGDSAGTQFNLRVLHKDDGTFTGAGTSEQRAVVPDVENVFDTQLPIQQGEFIGFNLPSGPVSDLPSIATRSAPGAGSVGWRPALVDGETSSPTAAVSPDLALLYNADVEPDCDADGLGDETQDPSLLGGTCPLRGRTLTLDANKNKVKKGKKVTLSGQLTEVARQGECQSGQIVELQRKKRRQTTFTTVEQLQTDAAGSFSTRKKVKKTFEYRAQVPETGGCGPQVSNAEKVKVKKKT